MEFILNTIFWTLALYGLFEIIKNIIYISTYTKFKSDRIYLIIAVKKQEEKIKEYNKYDISELRILYLMLNYDDVILYFENSLGYLIDPKKSKLAYKILEFKNDNGYFNLFDFQDSVLEDKELNDTLNAVLNYHNNKEYTNEELEDYINTIKEYSVKKQIEKLKQEMKDTLDINKKIEIAKKIENINKEVLKW